MLLKHEPEVIAARIRKGTATIALIPSRPLLILALCQAEVDHVANPTSATFDRMMALRWKLSNTLPT